VINRRHDTTGRGGNPLVLAAAWLVEFLFTTKTPRRRAQVSPPQLLNNIFDGAKRRQTKASKPTTASVSHDALVSSW
jgi:hypothetical protein